MMPQHFVELDSLPVTENGKIDPDTWPNAGVGRLNLDGSKGSCTSCHTRHRFSVAEARKPEACDQCHLQARSLGDLQATAQDCYACHAEDDTHDAIQFFIEKNRLDRVHKSMSLHCDGKMSLVKGM